MQLFGRGEEIASITAFLCCLVRACVRTKAVLALSGDLFEYVMHTTGSASSLFM